MKTTRRELLACAWSSLFLLLSLASCGNGFEVQDGDLIFQSSMTDQAAEIKMATGTPYSHMGIVFRHEDLPVVLEARNPVCMTPLRDWIERGEDHHFVMKRLRDAPHILTDSTGAAMRAIAEEFLNRPYDFRFEWSDSALYCSELVWKIYKRGTGLEIGCLQKLRDFDFSAPAVRAKLDRRYPEGIPWDETVISPAAMFDSDLLIEVARE